MSPANIAPSFWDVQAILHWLAWGRTNQQLESAHGTSFGWLSKEELLASFVDDGQSQYHLIQSDLIGVNRGHETNLVIALSTDDGVAGWGKMPKNGNAVLQYATPLQIDTIVRWIDAGCP